MRTVFLDVLTAPKCRRCGEFMAFWRSVAAEWPNVCMNEIDLLTEEGQKLARRHGIFSAPGIILGGELMFAGRYDKDQFFTRLRELSS